MRRVALDSRRVTRYIDVAGTCQCSLVMTMPSGRGIEKCSKSKSRLPTFMQIYMYYNLYVTALHTGDCMADR